VPDLRVHRRSAPQTVEHILRGLPDWFGIEEAIREYVADATTLPCYVALFGDRAVGVLLLRRHFPQSAEVHLLAVEKDSHRRGVGSALLAAAEADLKADGVQFLLVHTVGPSSDSEPYARTCEFYRARGFVPLQELKLIDWDGPTLILAKTILPRGEECT